MSGAKDSPMVIDSNESDSYDSEEDWSPPGSPRNKNDTPPPPPPGTTDRSPNNIMDGATDYVDVQESPVVVDEKAALLEEFERKKRARQLHVPTEDSKVNHCMCQTHLLY